MNVFLQYYQSLWLQEGQRPLTGQRAANFRLLANQWAERRLVTQWRQGCRAEALLSGEGRSLGAKISEEGVVPEEYFFGFVQN